LIIHLLGKCAGGWIAIQTIQSDIYKALYLAVPASPTNIQPILDNDKLKDLIYHFSWNEDDPDSVSWGGLSREQKVIYDAVGKKLPNYSSCMCTTSIKLAMNLLKKYQNKIYRIYYMDVYKEKYLKYKNKYLALQAKYLNLFSGIENDNIILNTDNKNKYIKLKNKLGGNNLKLSKVNKNKTPFTIYYTGINLTKKPNEIKINSIRTYNNNDDNLPEKIGSDYVGKLIYINNKFEYKVKNLPSQDVIITNMKDVFY
jgi:hypothetical protein